MCKVTAVRKFFFFLDPRRRGRMSPQCSPLRDHPRLPETRRGRISLQKMLSSPIMHELLELRRGEACRDGPRWVGRGGGWPRGSCWPRLAEGGRSWPRVAEAASHESGGCAGDLGQEELRQNWFSLECETLHCRTASDRGRVEVMPMPCVS